MTSTQTVATSVETPNAGASHEMRPAGSKKGRGSARTPLLLGLPALIIILVTQGYPLIRQFGMSFQEFGLQQQFGAAPEWVALGNYVDVLTDSTFWAVLVRSLIFCLVCAALTMIIGVAVALALTRLAKPVRVLLQSAMLLAWATPALSSLTVWQWLFNTRTGVVNWALTSLGFEQFDNFAWLVNTATFFVIAGAVVIWMSVPLVVFMVYASVMQVDTEILEAAQLDGATGWERFRHITAPTIAPVLMLAGLLQIIWDLRVFTQISVLQDAGGITEDTNVLGTYVYQVGLGQGDYGTGSALAMIMLALTLALTWGYVRQLLRQGDVS
jgi:N,N'-diacetylchitobiose transport system permease protein